MQNLSQNERGSTTQKDKIQSLLVDPNVKQKVLEKLESEGIKFPHLKLSVAEPQSENFIIEEFDVLKVFEWFGEVDSLKIEDKCALISYKSLVPAYFAIQILNGKKIPELNVVLQVSWHNPQDPSESFDENMKYTCRFDIQIENDKEFQVARRVIGSKGCNMKRIIEKCSKGMSGQAHDIIKLRLRGIGSGFKEGPNNSESNDCLHLCVSSKYNRIFVLAIAEIENLLRKVYKDYSEYCVKKGRADPKIKLLKIEKTSARSLVISPARMKEFEECITLNEEEIEELIDIRNETRRQCNFAEADKIRELLRKKGITLIDEKGRRGRGVEVTTWRYANY